MTHEALATILDASRKLWAGSDEAPAVRQVVYIIARALAAGDPSFNEGKFVRACGYEWRDEVPDDWTREIVQEATQTRACPMWVGKL